MRAIASIAIALLAIACTGGPPPSDAGPPDAPPWFVGRYCDECHVECPGPHEQPACVPNAPGADCTDCVAACNTSDDSFYVMHSCDDTGYYRLPGDGVRMCPSFCYVIDPLIGMDGGRSPPFDGGR
jgi:hypothetical protein